ncbi:GNAT family N-acetyltransferase [Haliangium sp.]|uniref:GNAT family N-acetyltransferase n=1 Tax=Haliangium sp. TaxID=2663208 RepID=UPI003D107500
MVPITLDDLDRMSGHFDRTVAATADIDHFCSSSAWILPAQAYLMPPRAPWLFRSEAGYVTMMRGRHPEGWHYVEPLESMWGLACPVVGPDPESLAAAVAELWRAHAGDWEVALISGVVSESPLCAALVRHLSLRYRLRLGPSTVRHVAELGDGFDAYWGRRSANFRRSLRRSLRAAVEAGVSFERADARVGAGALYERILAVEARSWKGTSGVGITEGGMNGFYRDMLPRLSEHGQLRVSFARHDGRDVGYIMGAVFMGCYRGLQFSYDRDYYRMSLGNLCQYHELVALCDEGVDRYDLGTDMDYKPRWADGTHDTVSLIAIRR